MSRKRIHPCPEGPAVCASEGRVNKTKKEFFIMIRSRAFFLCLMLAALNIAALAQEKRIEVSGSLGYTVASGFDINPVVINGRAVDRVGVNSGFSWGLQADYNVNDNIGVGFLFSRQKSRLTVSDVAGDKADIVANPIYNYMGVITYNFLDGDSKLRPYGIFGMGVTEYAPGTLTAIPGGSTTPVSINLENKAKFGMTYGGGVKYFLTPMFGFKMQGRWTPTYIGSQADGIWCNAFYCGVANSSKWSNQGEFVGGLIVRF
jgi:opacity protein-like surface antigen